jgi:hypothetical protein
MNRPLARRAGPFLALTGLLLTAAGAVPRRRDVLRLEPIEATTTR